ncbi:MAG: MlaE family ABC transporter permease [Burkholderiales bacterium]
MALREVALPDGARLLELAGNWNLQNLRRSLGEINPRLKAYAADPALRWDLTGISELDSAGAVILWRAWGEQRLNNLDLRPEHAVLFEQLLKRPPAPAQRRHRDRWIFIHWLGSATLDFVGHLLDVVALLGHLFINGARLLAQPRRLPWREISANIYRTGTQALPITALVGFLIGVVLSYLSTKQLRVFGADVFIVNILGISVLRELGPVLAAILVAGRSGSSMTAQLGVMRVTQELDALAVMGIPQHLRLILPKVLALTVALPLLALWTSAVALLGGAVAAQAELGIGIVFFFDRLPDVVPIANLWLGVGKGAVFGFLIALLACHFGLRIRPDTESLGQGTTTSVVASITTVILVDAVFAVMFSDVGIR